MAEAAASIRWKPLDNAIDQRIEGRAGVRLIVSFEG